MSTQVNQSENMSESDKMEFQKKISELSDTKTRYVYYIIKLSQIKNLLLMEQINQLIKFIRKAINIDKNPVFEELDECFTSLMLSYIYDIDDLLRNELDIEKYNDRHQNLIRINEQIEYQVKNYDPYSLNELKQTLLNV